jgi:hypothetical protein
MRAGKRARGGKSGAVRREGAVPQSRSLGGMAKGRGRGSKVA